MPNLGKAGTPYARSVQGKYPLPSTTLPDPGDVFDSLLKARDVSQPRVTKTNVLADIVHFHSSRTTQEAIRR